MAPVPLARSHTQDAHTSEARALSSAGKITLSSVDTEPNDPFSPELENKLIDAILAVTGPGRVNAQPGASEQLVACVYTRKVAVGRKCLCGRVPRAVPPTPVPAAAAAFGWAWKPLV